MPNKFELTVEKVKERASIAKANGASRLCMGAAWREVRDNKDFDRVLEMVSEVNNMGMEVWRNGTLGDNTVCKMDIKPWKHSSRLHR